MIVNAKIIEVTPRIHKDKSVVDVILRLAEPTDVIVVTLWNNAVVQGLHKQYADHAGKEVTLALRPDVFNGKLQYNLVTTFAPVPLK